MWCNPGSTASPTEESTEASSDKHMSEGKRRYFHLTLFFKCVWRRCKCSALWRRGEWPSLLWWDGLFVSQQAALQSSWVHLELPACFLPGRLLCLYFILFPPGQHSVLLPLKATCMQWAQVLGKGWVQHVPSAGEQEAPKERSLAGEVTWHSVSKSRANPWGSQTQIPRKAEF